MRLNPKADMLTYILSANGLGGGLPFNPVNKPRAMARVPDQFDKQRMAAAEAKRQRRLARNRAVNLIGE